MRQLFESRFNLLKVRAEGDRNFKLEIMNGEFGCESLGLGTSEHGSEAADTALFRATRIDAEEWVKSNGDEMWCTHRAWKDTGVTSRSDESGQRASYFQSHSSWAASVFTLLLTVMIGSVGN